MSIKNIASNRLTIRIGKNSLSFSRIVAPHTEQPISYEPFILRSGISMAANLREAFKSTDVLAASPQNALVLTDSPVLVVPIEQFEETEAETLYFHSFPKNGRTFVTFNVLPDLNAVAVFGINKDLCTVLNDRFENVSLIHTVAPVWRHLHQRSFTGHRSKLYGYFHDKQLEIFAFQQNRFKFCNSFETNRAYDALYFLLHVWKQLRLQPEHDELHLAGEIPEQDWLLEELHNYLQNAYVINPAADFNQAPASLIKGMPYDLMTLIVKGR